jgi:hypothetical protein
MLVSVSVNFDFFVDPDFVAIKARDLTAAMERDYQEDYVLQAEFQPGQIETFLVIEIL